MLSIESANHSYPFTLNLVLLGIPLLYFPVNTPEARGDQVVVPILYF